jgi:hypothetical protein
VFSRTTDAWNPESASSPLIGGDGAQVAFDGAHVLALGDNDIHLTPEPAQSDDLWSYDATGWQQVCANCSGRIRSDASIASVPSTGQTFLIGGYDTNEIPGTWTLETDHWQLLSATDPPMRDSVAVAYDPSRNQIVLYGGNGDSCTPNPGDNCDDTYLLIP